MLQDFIDRKRAENQEWLEQVRSQSGVPKPGTKLSRPSAKPLARARNYEVTGQLILGNSGYSSAAVALKRADIFNGVYVLGLNGTGKSSLLEYMLLQHARDGDGFALLDPHGDLTDNVLGHLAAAGRLQDVAYLDLTAAERVFGLNIFECDDPTDFRQVDEVASAAMSLFTRLWGISRSETPRLKMFLRHCSYTLIYTGYTLAEMYDLLTDATFRRGLVAQITNPQTLRFWKWYDGLKADRQVEVSESTLNKIDELLVSPFVQAIVGQSNSTFNVRQIMDEGKILLVRLDPKYEDISNLVGIAIVNRIRQATLSRREISEQQRRPFFLYADEFHRFVSRDFATQIDEGRKYRVGVVVAHQRGKQLGELEDVPEGVINVIVFKVTDADAQRHVGRFDYTPPEPEEPEEEEGPPPRIIPTVHVTDPLEHLQHNAHINPRVNELVSEITRLLVDEQSAKEARQQDYELRTRAQQDITALQKETFPSSSDLFGTRDYQGSKRTKEGYIISVTEDEVQEANVKARRALALRQREHAEQLGDSSSLYITTLQKYIRSYLLRWLYGTAPEPFDSAKQEIAQYMYQNLQPIFTNDTIDAERVRTVLALFTRLDELGELLREDKIYKADSQQFVIEYPQYPRTPYREPRRTFLDVREELKNELTIQRKFTARYRFDTDEGILQTVKPPEAPRLPAAIIAALVAHYPTVAEVAEQIGIRRTGGGAILPPAAYGQDDIPPQKSDDDDEEAYLSERKQ